MTLTRANFSGPWAGLPVAWSDDDRFDEPTYRTNIARCCAAGIPGVYTGGTTGEFYAMEFDEFQQVANATVEECHSNGKPAMVGCTSTYTLGAIRRAEFAASIHADAIQIALPFWMPIGDEQIVPFFRDVATSCNGLPLSIYETARSKRVLTLDQHRAIHEAVPSYLMVKATAGTIGAKVEGCASLSELVNVFVGEDQWALLGPAGARGGCSSMVYWNPQLFLEIWSRLEQSDWAFVRNMNDKIAALHEFLHFQFGASGFTDTTYDRLGGVATGFLKMSLKCRRPYPFATEGDVEIVRRWCGQYFPEMMQMDTVERTSPSCSTA